MISVSLLGTNLMLRFNEITKLRMECVTFYQDNPKIKILLRELGKNTTYSIEYIVEPWGGALAGSILLDTSFSLLHWILIRGDAPGYLFCSVSGSGKLNYERPIEDGVFTKWLQSTLISGGDGPESAHGYRLRSLKRGGVQIWKSLGRHDSWIMKRMHATGFRAFLRYAHNNRGVWPTSVHEFSSLEALQSFAGNAIASMLVSGTELSLPDIACLDEDE